MYYNPPIPFLLLATARRDFTLNALYYDPQSREVVDYVGGVQDAQDRVLRLVGDDAARLAEDPLRVLRAVRLTAVLGLRIAPATADAIRAQAPLCSPSAGAHLGCVQRTQLRCDVSLCCPA